MHDDREAAERLYEAASLILAMPVSEFRQYEPQTTAEAVVASLGKRSLMGDVKAFNELNKLATFALETEKYQQAIDPLSESLTKLAQVL